MDLFLIIGIVIGALAVVVGMIVKGASITALLNPAAAIIIFVGTTAAVMNSFPKNEFLNIPRVLRSLLREKSSYDSISIIEQLIQMAQMARRDGLLSLEETVQNMEDPFLRNGMTLVVDGLEHDYIRKMLETEIESIEDRHRAAAAIFSAAGSYAPTLGVLGAVIGLIGALGNLNDMEKLGPMIAAAFVATLYGIFLGYVLCHPIASRLKRKSAVEVFNLRLMVEGILAIQAGENPNNIKIKLSSMLNPEERKEFEKREKALRQEEINV
ncbi:MAG: flagellar motor stator protein MotA [Desulfitobacteriia bacterium]|jgi:chemotaxis protein MotA